MEIIIKETAQNNSEANQATETPASEAQTMEALGKEFGRLSANFVTARKELKVFLDNNYSFLSAFKYGNIIN